MSDLFLYFLLLEILYCNTLRIFCNVIQKDTNLSEHNFVKKSLLTNKSIECPIKKKKKIN